MLTPNLFSLVTGKDWQMRRTMFKHSFSSNSLRNFHDIMRSLTDKMVTVLKTATKQSSKPIELDVLFGQMTMDVICNVAFGFDIKALDTSPLFMVSAYT